MDENCDNSGDEIQSIHVKLFLWAVFFDHYNLSLHFWRRLNVNCWILFYFLHTPSLVGSSMWSFSRCTSLSSYRWFVCQTKFNRIVNSTTTTRSCKVSSYEIYEYRLWSMQLYSEYENLAIRLLQALRTFNANTARLAIKRENFEFNKLSSLDVARKCLSSAKIMSTRYDI